MRVILRSYSTGPIAEMMAERLRELDMPVIATRSHTPEDYFGTGGEWEVWLEDDSILENPEWKRQIEEVLASDSEGLTPEQEDAIANMPLVDVVIEEDKQN